MKNFDIKKSLASLAFVATLFVAGGSADRAEAVTLGSCVGTGFDVTGYVTPTSLCFSLPGLSDGDGDKLTDLNGVEINGSTGGWSDLGKFEATGSNSFWSLDDNVSTLLEGEWNLFAAATSMYGEFMMIFKAGQDRNTDPAAFVGYILDGTSGDWRSPLLEAGKTTQREISNVHLYARGTPTVPVPVPAAGVLLITALGGLGLAARRRKAA